MTKLNIDKNVFPRIHGPYNKCIVLVIALCIMRDGKWAPFELHDEGLYCGWLGGDVSDGCTAGPAKEP